MSSAKAALLADVERQVQQARNYAPFFAFEDGYPVSGDRIREFVYDPHPTQPFRMGDVLWPRLRTEPEYEAPGSAGWLLRPENRPPGYRPSDDHEGRTQND